MALNHFTSATSAGPSGITYEHAVSSLKGSDRALELGRQCINLILNDTLPRCDSLPDIHLVALSKPGCPGSIRPIAVCEVWQRLASLCSLVELSLVGTALTPFIRGWA